MIAKYHSIETFSSVDGPGIRYVLFLQGCNMFCQYCHNPDMISSKTNKIISIYEVISDFKNYEPFYNNGGITISGGEPLLQLDFVNRLFTELKKYSIHTCIETNGSLFDNSYKFKQLIKVCDLFIVNLKGVDNTYANKLSKCNIDYSLAFIDFLKHNNKNFILSYVLIPTINDNQYCIDKLGEIIKTYDADFKILPYHKLGIKKWESLNKTYNLDKIKEPTTKELEDFISKIKDKLKPN